ncbi:MAG: histidine phosphatase family protein [Anaerolineales bacterium]|jgi:uncharacterized phosphatase
MTHTFTFLRHGLSVGNKNDIVQGQMDFPLSEEGIHQARQLASHWFARKVTFDLIISSPLTRARRTAEILQQSLSCPIEFDDRWKERLSGIAQGISYEQIDQLFGDRPFPSSHDPIFDQGESEWDLFMRAAASVQDLVRRPQGSYLIVAHGAVLSAAFRSIMGISPPAGRVRPVRISFENTGYSIFDYDADMARWSLRKHNVTDHLEDSLLSGDRAPE